MSISLELVVFFMFSGMFAWTAIAVWGACRALDHLGDVLYGRQVARKFKS